MGKLTKEQADQLAALEAQRDSPDDPEDDEVSWYERTKDGERGATMRVGRARKHGPAWLREHLADKDQDAGDDGQGDDDDAGKDQPARKDSPSAHVRRFQRSAG